MHSKKYRKEVLRTATSTPPEKWLELGAIGLAEEAGEVLGLLKKHVFHKHELNREKMLKELGDVRWYFELICTALNTTIDEIEEVNIKKTTERYPEGFTPEKSINRKKED
jgi:NTP pyrophosphatase (non-canonical NTP hydrolase)